MSAQTVDLKHTPRQKNWAPMFPDFTLPYSGDDERAVLGCVLLGPEVLSAVKARAGSEAFYDLRHRAVFEAMEAVDPASLNEPAEYLFRVRDKLMEQEPFKQQPKGEVDVFLHQMTSPVMFGPGIDYYLDQIVEKWVLRRILTTCYETAAKVNEGGDLSDLLDEFERRVMAVRPKSTKERTPIKEVVKQCICKIEEFHQNHGRILGMSTGFIDWDKLTGGLKPGEITVIAAYPGTGKTALALNVVEHVALDQKLAVGIFSLEMSAESLVMRMMCSRARVNLRNVADGFLAERDFPKLTTAARKIANSLIHLHDISDLSVEEYRTEARRMVHELGVKLIVVDYLQLLTASGSRRKVETRQDEVAAVSGGIKKSALELGIPIIALSQLNDDGKLRESRAIGQDADNVGYLQKEDSEDGQDYSEAQPVTLELRKQRNGPAPVKVRLTFLKGYTRFENAAKVHDEDLPGHGESHYKQPHND